MSEKVVARGIVCTLLGMMLAASIINSATKPAFTQQQEKTAEQVYKNIQVLKGIPASQLRPAMTFIAGSLGVSCEHCHTNPWESDIKPAKQIARRHIQMTQSINNENFGGKMVITCNTCHQGQPQPPSTPTIAQAAWLKFGSKAESIAPTGSLPTVDQVFDKYVQAVGGKAAVEKLKTQVLKGSLTSYNAMTKTVALSLEIYEAPNRRLVVINTPQGSSYQGFNGTTGWIINPVEKREMSAEELSQFKQGAELYKIIKLKEFYTRKNVIGRVRIGDREAYVVEVTLADGKPEKLLFDIQTGLLIRKRVESETVLGTIFEETDFEDYRNVEGVKLPFTIRLSKLDSGLIRKFTEIKLDVPIDEAKFNMPVTK
jgi:photosynthetic reaction center cytochrome c subunit